MKRLIPVLCLAAGLVVWFAGCTVSEKGSLLPDQPPVTTLTVAPLEGDTVNHYIELRWSASDPDGDVVAFKLQVDSLPRITTTARDTTIGFPAPNNGEIVQHTFAVSAIDDNGMEGSAASRMFYTVNFSPGASFDPDGSVPNTANVGPGFRMTVAAADSNPSTMLFAISVDDTLDFIWSPDSAFLFADPRLHKYPDDQTVVGVDDDGDGRVDEELENRDAHGNRIDDDHDGRLDEDTRGLFPEHVRVVPNDELTPGAHTIYARVMDAGGALSPIISRTVTVLADRAPTMDQTVSGTYNGRDIYADGSVYFVHNVEAKLVFRATAAQYRGEINGYAYYAARLDSVRGDSVMSNFDFWSSSPEVTSQGLPVGEYEIRMVARDIAGALSDTITYVLRIVSQRLTTNIIIVDETRNGTGGPGSPTDAQVDDFYASIFDGLNWTQVDYDQGPVTPNKIKDAGVIMWHADDKTDIKLADNARILGEFLDKGGRLILSGWDVLGAFAIGAGDSVEYLTSSFAYNKLHLFGAARNTSAAPRTSIGLQGVDGNPSCFVDSTKLPPSWHGALDKVWTFDPRGENRVVGVLAVINPGANPYEGRPVGYVYDLSFRVAVFGLPFYFCYQEQVYDLMRVQGGIVDQMLAGLQGP